MSLYLCVDCGGSKTSAVIANASGQIVGRALGGPSNFAYLGLDAFLEAVNVCVGDALKTCVSPPSKDALSLPPPAECAFSAAWFGVSGVDNQSAIDMITPPLSALLGIPQGPQLTVCNDAHLLAAPLRSHPDVHHAVACIGGTGSNVVSFAGRPDGTLQELGRVGGWGWILSDEGGGFHVGREAIRQIIMQADIASVAGPPPPLPPGGASTLKARVMALFGIADVYELLTIVHFPDPLAGSAHAQEAGGAAAYTLVPREKRLSQLAPLVFESAFEDGDPLAISVLKTTSGALVDQICVLLRPEAEGAWYVRAVKASDSVLCFGGSLVGVEEYRRLILDGLAARGHIFKYVEFVADAAATGALSMAANTR